MSAEQRRVLVTGASRGIGRATAEIFARQGWLVYASYRAGEAAARSLAQEAADRGQTIAPVKMDLGDADSVERAMAEILGGGPLTALVANAAEPHATQVIRLRRDDVQNLLSANLASFFQLVQASLRGMIKARSGAIVAVSSIAATRAFAGQSAYVAAKAGLSAAALSIAQEYGSFGIRANVVVPGVIDTDMAKSISVENLCPRVAMGRKGHPREVGEVIYFLCSDQASYVSGAVVPVTGGALV